MKRKPRHDRARTGKALLLQPGRSVSVPGGSRWRWHEAALQRLRRKLVLRQLWELQDSVCRPGVSTPEANELKLDFVIALLEREPDAIGELNAAIERIHFGCYGVCEDTGLPIPPPRLRATPWLRRLRDVPASRALAAAAVARMPARP